MQGSFMDLCLGEFLSYCRLNSRPRLNFRVCAPGSLFTIAVKGLAVTIYSLGFLKLLS